MHFLKSISIVALIILSLSSTAQTWLSGYQYRKPITIAAGDISGTGTLSNFPVLVSLTSVDLNSTTAHVTSASGFDIVFSDSDGATALPHQLINFNASTGTIEAWVQLDLDGTSGNTFYIYYGDSDVTTDQSSNTTWNSSYVGVWTLDETTSTAGATYSDLTSNSNDLTDNGGSTNITGKVGNAQNFDGTGDWLQVDDNTSLRNITDQFTFSAWVRLDGAQANDYGIIIKNEDGTYYQHMGVEGTERPSFRVRTGGVTIIRDDNDINFDLNDGGWHHIVGVYDGANMIFYVDGMEEDNIAKTGNVDTNTEPLLLGRRAIGDNRFYDGDIDEARYLNVGLSAEWVGTEFTNQDAPASFVSGGTEESIIPIDGGTATAASNELFSGNATTVSLSGFTFSGTTLQWQSSTDGINFTDVVDGSGENGVVYTTAALTVDSYFRCIVDDGVESVASTTALVSIKSEFSSGDGPSGYSLRRKLTIDNTQVAGSSNHTNFPVLVRLTGSKAVPDLVYAGNGGDVAHQDGYDIIFTSSDGTTVLDHQIEQYESSTGEYVAWVLMPSLSFNTDTELYMYYGNPDVTTDPSDALFDSEYVGTWHLHEEYDDAVSTGNDGIAFGSVTNDAGIIANGARISPVDEDDFSRIEVGTFDPDQTNITVSGWFNREASNDGADDARIISKSDGQAAASHVFMISIVGGDDNRIRLSATEADDSNAELLEARQNINFTPGSWVYSAFTYTANGNILVYEDGVLVDTETGLNDREKIEQNTDFRVAIGNNPGTADGGNPTTRKPFDGVIDEVRVASVVRSADWLLTEYNNQQESSTFCSMGEEEGCDVAGGTVSGIDENIFTGESTTLSTTGSSGTLQWQSSTDNVTFSDIGGATSASYTTSALTQTTYFRVTAASGDCTDVSNIITVNVQGRFLSNYAFRKSIAIDKSKVAGSTALSEFPLLVSITDAELATTANGGNVYDTDAGNGTLGDDITFTDASGNELTQYREEYNDATGELVVWVKIPSLSATQDTEIFLYYGNCTGSGLPNLFNTNTWNNDSNSDDYAAVWLMNDGTPTTVADATSNNRDGTGNGLAASTAGQIDDALDFEDGDANDNFTYSTYTSSGSSLTVSAWINPESLAAGVGDDAIILSHGDFELKTIVANLAVDENELSFEVSTGNGTVSTESLPSDLAAGSFIMITGVYDGSNVIIYENGNPIASAVQTGTLSGTNSDILIGNNAADGLPFDGLIDHVTILPAARSADWVKTMYNNQSDPSSFYTYASGNQESQITWIGTASGDETNFNNPNNWSNCLVPEISESIILESGLGNYPVLTQATQVDDLIIESGASFGLGGFELTVTGRLTNDGTFTHGDGKVTFSGTAEQQVSGSSAITFYDVEVNNSGNEVRIEASTTIENTVTLTNGFFTISDNSFVITSTGEIAGGSSSSFFITEGTECLEQEDIGATGRAGNILFPLGVSSTEYTPITINNIGTDDDFCVRVADNALSDGSTGSVLTSNVLDKTWFIDETVVGGSNVTLTLQWNIGDELTGFDRTDMFIRHYTSSWVQYESGISASNPSTNVYASTTSGVTSFSPVGGGSGDGPLPIELLSFDAIAKDAYVNLEWSTASETNNDYFSIYHSADGLSFNEIGKIDGAGNSSELLSYQWKDLAPSLGANYYYLRQTDFDGEYDNAEIKRVDVSEIRIQEVRMIVYPNPSTGAVGIDARGFGSNQEVTIQVKDISGKTVYANLTTSNSYGNLAHEIVLTNPDGIYFIEANSLEKTIKQRLVIRK